jgi:two-component system OmpR family response regulator
MNVVVLRWPSDERMRDELACQQVARLLLVEDGSSPPENQDGLEDWIRIPAPERDIRMRVDALGRWTQWHASSHPTLDDDGVLRIGGKWVGLPPVEARLTGALLERFGAVVSRERLSIVGWPGGAPQRNVLDVHVLRLRRRIGPLGLAIRTVRSRGYLLDQEDAA